MAIRTEMINIAMPQPERERKKTTAKRESSRGGSPKAVGGAAAAPLTLQGGDGFPHRDGALASELPQGDLQKEDGDAGESQHHQVGDEERTLGERRRRAEHRVSHGGAAAARATRSTGGVRQHRKWFSFVREYRCPQPRRRASFAAFPAVAQHDKSVS